MKPKINFEDILQKPDFDEAIRPQDDFFGYVNNKWLNKNPIPPNENSWGTFYVLRNKSSESIQKIVGELSEIPHNKLTHDQKLITNFFSTALSFSKFTPNHLTTLEAELQAIRDIKNKGQIPYYLGRAHRYDFSSFWNNYVSLDDKDSQIQVLRINQGGLRLPNRDYYLDSDTRMQHIRNEYKNYFNKVNEIFPLGSYGSWEGVFSIEKRLAYASWTDIELRDVEKNYSRFTIKQLRSRFPKFDWLEYFEGLGWRKPNDNIVIDQPSFIDEIIKIIRQSTLDELKGYLSWHVINHLFGWVNERTAEIYFDFYGRIITGMQKNNTVEKRAVLQSNKLIIGEVLGREYARRYFPESSKMGVLEIVQDVRTAYHKRINDAAWMKDATKKIAHRKLDNIKVLVGYPSVWHDLGKLEFSLDNHLSNILSAQSYLTDIALEKIGKKPPIEDWKMNAHEVNAYFDPNQLEICFPAAILQPPFYDPNASYAVNLGGVGSVIGHEFTHGFDDQGSEFDEYGNISRWQSVSEKKAFNTLASSLAKLADNYEILPGTFLKGKLVIGEAIADIGGVVLATEALKSKINLTDIDKCLRELFISYAITERGDRRKEFSLQLAKTDPHPPSRFRVNCTLQHLDDFYKVFDIQKDDSLFLTPENRVNIW